MVLHEIFSDITFQRLTSGQSIRGVFIYSKLLICLFHCVTNLTIEIKEAQLNRCILTFCGKVCYDCNDNNTIIDKEQIYGIDVKVSIGVIAFSISDKIVFVFDITCVCSLFLNTCCYRYLLELYHVHFLLIKITTYV